MWRVNRAMLGMGLAVFAATTEAAQLASGLGGDQLCPGGTSGAIRAGNPRESDCLPTGSVDGYVQEKTQATAEAKAYADEPYVVERLQTKVRFEADGKRQRETSIRVRVQSESAVKQFGLLVYPYMASFESLELVYAGVRKPDGTVVETPASEVQELDSAVSREAPMYTDEREKHIAIKSLGAGDVLEVRLRWTSREPIAPGHFWYDDIFFQQGICLAEEHEINVPSSVAVKLGPSGEPVMKEEAGRRIYTFHSSHLTKGQEEEIPAWEKNFHGVTPPAVRISSFATWAEVGAWYGGLQQPRVQVTPAILAKAEELTRGKTSELEKTKAIYDFVSTRFRYIGIDLGAGRYTPHLAEEVLANRYGDCKDKHTLFAALLEAVGIKAYPALVSSTYKIDPAMPSASLFDHVTTAIPQGDSYLFLDTTQEVAPFGLLLQGLRDRDALVIPANAPAKLVRTPADPPFRSLEKYEMDAVIQLNGTLDGKGRLEDRGDAEVMIRAAYRNTPQNRWKELAQEMVARMGFAGTVSEVNVAPPESTADPFWFTYAYHRTDYSDWKEHHRITLPFPPFLLPDLTEGQKASKEPLPLGSVQDVVYEASVKVPEGVMPILPGKVECKTDFAEYTASYTLENGVIRGSRHLIIKLREVPGTERIAFSNFVRAVSDDEQKWIFLAGDFSADIDARRGVKLLGEGKTAEAVAILEKQVQENPDNVWFKLMLGRAYLGIPDEAKAVELFRGMLEDTRDPAGMLNGVAYELANSNHRISEAVEYATRAVTQTEASTMKAELELAMPIDYQRISALAAQWDTLGLANLRAGNTALAEKYLRSAWLLWQRATIGEHLIELYEKQGNKKEATRICAMALAAPGKDDEPDTRKKLTAAQERLGVPKTYTVNAKEYQPSGAMALTDLRAVKIPLPPGYTGDQKSATFGLAVENGRKDAEIKFVSGAAELKAAAKGLATVKYQIAFPDDHPTRILRQGLLSCSRYTKECTFVMFPLYNTPGMFEGTSPLRFE
jgi:transglutaminase-like putative cysteine protease/tetratricopeptide (TPR) repeat protein